MEDAIVRLVLEYAAGAFEFHLVKRPQMDEWIRLPQDQVVSDMSPSDLLDKFWQASHVPEEDVAALQALAVEILEGGEENAKEVEAEETEEKVVVPVE